MLFRKSKNRKLIEKKYKNGEDVSWYIPSIKKLMIENEYILDNYLESHHIEAVNNKRDTYTEIRRNIRNIVRDTLVNALITAGKGKA